MVNTPTSAILSSSGCVGQRWTSQANHFYFSVCQWAISERIKKRAHTANTHPGLMAVVPFSGGRVSPWGDYSFCCSCACVNTRGLIYTRGRCRKVNKTWTRQTFFPSQKKNRNGWWDAEEALPPCDFCTAIRRIIGCWVTELLFLCLC